MEKSKAVVIGVAVLVAALAVLGGAAYAVGGQMGNGLGAGIAGMMGIRPYSGGMMGGDPSGWHMGEYQGMMSGVGAMGCDDYMQQYLNSTYPR